jgi:hypothetical protein
MAEKIILVGKPGRGKSLAATRWPDYKLYEAQHVNNYALGELADYRLELLLATERMLLHLNDQDIVMTTSLVDSVAYPLTRIVGMSNSGSVSAMELDRWTCTVATNLLIFRDSFESTKVYTLFDEPAKTGDFYDDLEDNLLTVLKEYNIDYELLNSLD